jgi:hypothetical protein
MTSTASHIFVSATGRPQEQRCDMCRNLSIHKLLQAVKIELATMEYVSSRPEAFAKYHSSLDGATIVLARIYTISQAAVL